MYLENPGIDPGTSRMRSGRSTIWANPPQHITFFENHEENYFDRVSLGICMIYTTLSSWQSCAVIGYMTSNEAKKTYNTATREHANPKVLVQLSV